MSPSRVSRCRASRTGVRLTASRAASRLSRSGSASLRCPWRIAARSVWYTASARVLERARSRQSARRGSATLLAIGIRRYTAVADSAMGRRPLLLLAALLLLALGLGVERVGAVAGAAGRQALAVPLGGVQGRALEILDHLGQALLLGIAGAGALGGARQGAALARLGEGGHRGEGEGREQERNHRLHHSSLTTSDARRRVPIRGV